MSDPSLTDQERELLSALQLSLSLLSDSALAKFNEDWPALRDSINPIPKSPPRRVGTNRRVTTPRRLRKRRSR